MGRKTIDLTGQRFGRLVVEARIPREPGTTGQAKWLCRCGCGATKSVGSNALRSGATRSCGCLLNEVLTIRNTGRGTPDLTGQKFERLLVIERDPERSSLHRAAYWRCLCDCGNTAYASGYMLRTGQHKSCGCLKTELTIARSTKHGGKPRTGASRAYNSWHNMLARCTSPNHPRYADWGGRGITVCERWHDFANFLADMGEPPPGKTLHRKDNDGDYCLENCVWASPAEQARERRGVKLTPTNITKIRELSDAGLTMTAIGKQLGMGRHTVAKALWTG